MTQFYRAPSTRYATWTVTTPGECPVYATGNTPELGEWHADKALQMRKHRLGGHVVEWTADLSLEPGQTIEFKFVQKTETGDVRWEEGPNRVFRAQSPGSTTHWGAFRTYRAAQMLDAA